VAANDDHLLLLLLLLRQLYGPVVPGVLARHFSFCLNVFRWYVKKRKRCHLPVVVV